MLIDLLGWLGVLCALYGQWRVSSGAVNPRGVEYLAWNWLSVFLMAFAQLPQHAYQSLAISSAFAAIVTIGFTKSFFDGE
jgi:hypothetical protein